MGRTRTFASLRVHNYRVFFFCALFSNIGTWLSRTAQAWLVLTILTPHSATALGIATALQFGPMLFLAPYGGVIADRFPKRVILIFTQAGMALTQLIQWALIVTGTVQLWHVYAIALATATVVAFDNPARQAFASEMVPGPLLSNAVGLNSASFNAARLIGPALAGLLINWWGVAPPFLFNGLSFFVVIGGLLMMRPAELTPARPRRGKGAFLEGVRYVAKRPDIQLIIIVIFIFGALGMNFQVTTALMATVVFHKNVAEYGILGSVMAIGSLIGALLNARRERPRMSVFLLSLTAFVVVATGLALAPSYLWFAVLLAPVGMASILGMNTANARIQLTIDAEVRGRVMSLYMAIFMGSTLVGAPIIGWVGDHWGARWTILVGAIGTAVALVGAAIYLGRTGELTRDNVRGAFVRSKRVALTEDTTTDLR